MGIVRVSMITLRYGMFVQFINNSNRSSVHVYTNYTISVVGQVGWWMSFFNGGVVDPSTGSNKFFEGGSDSAM